MSYTKQVVYSHSPTPTPTPLSMAASTPTMSMRPLQPRGDASATATATLTMPATARPLQRPLSSSSSAAPSAQQQHQQQHQQQQQQQHQLQHQHQPANVYSAPSIGMKRKATTACRNCQKKRTRCSAGWPCSNCARSNVECHYAPLADRRRKDFANAFSAEEMSALSQKIADQESQLAFFRRAWSCLQADDERQAFDLVSLIRKGASTADLKDFLDRSTSPDTTAAAAAATQPPTPSGKDPMLPTKTPAATTTTATTIPSRRAPSMRALCDEPVLSVPAYPWTTVTSDDSFVSHLISLWFTWSEPYMSWIHRDLFVRDMRSGNLQSTFCSRFLVNAMCAQACAWSDYPEANLVPSDKTTSGMHFHEQARREYDALEGRTSITVVQGLTVFAIATMLAGKDRRGWHLLQSAVAQTKELRANGHPDVPDADRSSFGLVYDRLEWGLFNYSTCASLALQVEPLMAPPRRSRPPIDHDCGPGLSWRPYPHPVPETSIHQGCFINSQCSLVVIGHRINRLLHPGESDPIYTEAEQENMAKEILEDLRVWRTTLPDCLDLQKFTMPSLLTLYMLYECLVMAIGSSLRFSDGPKWDTLGPYDQTLSSGLQQRSPGSIRCYESAVELSRLMAIFRKSWSLERTPVCFNHWTTLAAIILLESLADTRSHAAFTGLCHFLRAGCRRWVVTRGLMRTVQLRAREMGVCQCMPSEAYNLFVDFEARDWREDKASETASLLMASLAKPQAAFKDSMSPQAVATSTWG